MISRSRKSRASIALAVAALLATAACGGGSNNTKSAANDLQVAQPGTLTIAAGIPYLPFEYTEKDGTLVGFDVDLFKEISKELRLKSKWLNVAFSNQFTSLAGHKVDVVPGNVTGYAPKGSIAAKTVETRQKIVSFGTPYFDSSLSIMVNKDKTPNITTRADLKTGDVCAIATSQVSQYWSEQHLQPQGVKLSQYDEAAAMYNTLVAGKVDCVVYDAPPSHVEAERFSQLKIIEDVPTGEQAAFVYAKDRSDLQAAIDKVLKRMYADGSFATMYKKYFPGAPMPSYVKE